MCPPLPEEYRRHLAYADPESADFVSLYTYADPDALIELFGHIRARNPEALVTFHTADELSSHHYTAHLEALATAVQTGNRAGIDQGLAEVSAGFDRVTNAQTQIGIELARLPEDRARLVTQHDAADARRSKAEDANLAESIAAMTQADQAHRAALGAIANAGRLSLMDYIK